MVPTASLAGGDGSRRPKNRTAPMATARAPTARILERFMVDLEVWWDVDGESGKRMARAIRRGHASTYRPAPERLVSACTGGSARRIAACRRSEERRVGKGCRAWWALGGSIRCASRWYMAGVAC